jgi:hypothetical protein
VRRSAAAPFNAVVRQRFHAAGRCRLTRASWLVVAAGVLSWRAHPVGVMQGVHNARPVLRQPMERGDTISQTARRFLTMALKRGPRVGGCQQWES